MDSVLMIDGGFLKKKFKGMTKRHMVADDVVRISRNILKSANLETGSYRVYYYDCPPSKEEVTLPISKSKYSFAATSGYNHMVHLLDELKRKDFFAVREGVLSFKGWTIKSTCYDKCGNITVQKHQ